MARPIKETPILTGNDAKRFVEKNKQIIKESGQAKERINMNYKALKGISRF